MLRVTKLTDYGIVLLTHFARHPEREAQNARELALETRLPLPTVGKLLKELAHGGLLVSQRGINGGYSLARPSNAINVADIIGVLDGPIAITECNSAEPGLCEHETCCPLRGNWQIINAAIKSALETITLAEMASPLPGLFSLTPPRERTREVHLTP